MNHEDLEKHEDLENNNDILSSLWISDRRSWILIKKTRILVFYDERYLQYLEVLLNIDNPSFFTIDTMFKVRQKDIPDFLFSIEKPVFPYKSIEKMRIRSAFIERNYQIEQFLYIGNYYRDIYLFQNGLESFHACKIWNPKEKKYIFDFYTLIGENEKSLVDSIFKRIQNLGESMLSKLFRPNKREN